MGTEATTEAPLNAPPEDVAAVKQAAVAMTTEALRAMERVAKETLPETDDQGRQRVDLHAGAATVSAALIRATIRASNLEFYEPEIADQIEFYSDRIADRTFSESQEG